MIEIVEESINKKSIESSYKNLLKMGIKYLLNNI